MTYPTKAIYKYLIQDSVRVSNTSSTSDQRTSLYTEADHISTLTQIETIDFYTTHTINGVQVTPYPAGHVLGAAMFLISIAGLNILFTGDYSTEEDRHLVSAAVPDQKKVGKIDLLISESTFGISSAPPREEREYGLLINCRVNWLLKMTHMADLLCWIDCAGEAWASPRKRTKIESI